MAALGRRAWLTVVALMLPVAAPAQQSAPQGSFTPSQRAEIVAIIRQAMKSDPSILRDAVLALQQDQQAKTAAASTQAIVANKGEIFSNPGDPVAGNPNGKITLVEFFDVRCPYCRASRQDVERLLAQDPDIRIVMKDLPVLGPASVLGAKALLAARSQGGYLKMQHALMQTGVTVDPPTIERAAEAAGLNWPALQAAMQSPGLQVRIDENLSLAMKLGIQGTPAFVVGDQLVAGAMSFQEMQQAVAALRRG
jgi:protein-disulfide isomerase